MPTEVVYTKEAGTKVNTDVDLLLKITFFRVKSMVLILTIKMEETLRTTSQS
jgi:hypothetical protein